MKINFTKENFAKLKELAVAALLENHTYISKMGQVYTVYELLHTVSINQLTELKNKLTAQINKMEEKDEWVEVDTTLLDELKEKKELIHLIIGYKRYNLEKAENARKKEQLTKKLAELKESTKTPEDRIKEMEAELASLEDF